MVEQLSAYRYAASLAASLTGLQPLESLLDHRHSIAASLRFASQLNRIAVQSAKQLLRCLSVGQLR